MKCAIPKISDRPIASIFLAAGKGKRMASNRLPKVCFPVVGVPAINRSIAACRACGIGAIIVVVGRDGDQVVETVSSEFEGVVFVRQREPLGTGDGMRVGFEPLARLGFDGLVLCAYGDKVVQEEAVRFLLKEFARRNADAAIAVSEKPDASDMGRVLLNRRGDAEGIVEDRNLRAAEVQLRLAQKCAQASGMLATDQMKEICLAGLGSESACVRFLGRTWGQLVRSAQVVPKELLRTLPSRPGFLQIGSRWVSAARIRASSPYMNESLYLFRAEDLAGGLRRLRRGSHGEMYFTDIIATLAGWRKSVPPRRIASVVLKNRDWLLGFNSPDQLLDIEERIRGRIGVQRIAHPRAVVNARLYKPAGEWLRRLGTFGSDIRKRFESIYGCEAGVIEERRNAMCSAVRRFCAVYGAERRVVIARAPAMVNIMGRHVDVVGGFVNVANVNREAVVVAAPRDDDLVRLLNADSRSRKPEEFAIGREIASIGWDDWLSYITSERVLEMLTHARGEWRDIVRAAAVRLQQHFKSQRLRGLDAVVHSNIPLAAGLGASSAMLVAASEVFVTLNALRISAEEFVRLCGEGEWYLGSRGTAASHAGMKLGRRGCVAHLRSFPVEVKRLVSFPPAYSLALLRTTKTEDRDAGQEMRARAVAAMNVGLLILRDHYPHLAHRMEYVRDVSPAALGVTGKDLYGMLLTVPPRATARVVRRRLSAEGRERGEEVLGNIPAAQPLDLRDALCFGVAECARSALLADLLEAGDMVRIADLLRASHDAERVVGCDGDGQSFTWTASDKLLRRCMEDLLGEDPERVRRAQIELLPGRFGPASPYIDRLVDLAQAVPGVVGAQLSGAGAGGFAMAMVRTDYLPVLRRMVHADNVASGVEACSFVEGAGILEI